MEAYQEITLLPDSDIPLGFLWQKVYQQIHIALVEHKVGQNQSEIAIGFPEYGSRLFPLGRKIRLFSPQKKQLEQLNMAAYLSRLSDYVHLRSVQVVPETKNYVTFTRHHAKGEARIDKDHRDKALLWAKKTGKPIQECMAELAKTRPESGSSLPFIWMESQGAKKRDGSPVQKFPLFIERIISTEVQAGRLNCYGLSHPGEGVTLPVF